MIQCAVQIPIDEFGFVFGFDFGFGVAIQSFT